MVWPKFRSASENPYLELLYKLLQQWGVEIQEFSPRRLRRGEHAPNVWHLHWPERLLKFSSPFGVLRRLIRFRRRLSIARARGVRIVWTAHNLDYHDGAHPLLSVLFWRMFLRRVEGCIHLSEAAREAACRRYPEVASIPGFVVPHMHYRGRCPDDIGREAAKQRLGLPPDSRVVLFVGQIRPYKNVPRLIEAFQGLEDPGARLLVVGKVLEAELVREIELAARNDDRITVISGFVPDEALQFYLRAADLAVAPYREILNSGTALLALSFGCPILVPDTGSLHDLSSRVGSTWVRLYWGEFERRDSFEGPGQGYGEGPTRRESGALRAGTRGSGDTGRLSFADRVHQCTSWHRA